MGFSLKFSKYLKVTSLIKNQLSISFYVGRALKQEFEGGGSPPTHNLI